MVYDITRRSTYNHLSSWLTDARNLTNPNTVWLMFWNLHFKIVLFIFIFILNNNTIMLIFNTRAQVNWLFYFELYSFNSSMHFLQKFSLKILKLINSILNCTNAKNLPDFEQVLYNIPLHRLYYFIGHHHDRKQIWFGSTGWTIL